MRSRGVGIFQANRLSAAVARDQPIFRACRRSPRNGSVHDGAHCLSFTLLICPADQSGLIQTAEEWNCPECGRSYPVRRGVVKFLDTQDSFYEAAYLNQVHFLPASESWYRVWPVWLINNGYLWRVRNNVPAGATVLELGCAGGVAY